MEKVASITRYKGQKELVDWLTKLPRKYPIDYIIRLLKVAKRARFLIWTEKHDIKMLK